MPQETELYNLDLLSEENVRANVLPFYGLQYADITQIKFKDTDKQRAVYKVIYENKSYCLKKVYFNESDLLFVYSAIEWLYRNEIKVPRIEMTNDKGRFVKYKNMFFILTAWIDGNKCDYDNIEQVLTSSEVLARIHKCSRDFKPIIGSSSRDENDDIFTSLQKHFIQLLSCSNFAFKYNDRFSKLFLQYFDSNISLAKLAVNISSTINTDNLSKSLCHMDYVNKNILFADSNKDMWLIDFDRCKIDYCVHDIGYFLRRLLKRDNTKWDVELAINILNNYNRIKPLSIDEYKYLVSYLAFPQKFWKISRDYYNNIVKCNKVSFITLLSKSVNKDDYQINFIYQFIESIEKKFNTKLT
jgi:CotS family spore coat protein